MCHVLFVLSSFPVIEGVDMSKLSVYYIKNYLDSNSSFVSNHVPS
jgi:hypothetical protein